MIEEVTDRTALVALGPAWTELADRLPTCTPFQRPEWLLPWLTELAPGARPWVLTARSEAPHSFAALAPFLLDASSGEETVRFIGTGISDHLDVVGEPEAMEALVEHLGRRCDRWCACDLEALSERSLLTRARLPRGLVDILEAQVPCPVLRFPPEARNLGDVLPRSMARRLARAERVAARTPGLTFTLAGADARRAPGEIERILDALFRLHAAQWSRRGEPGVLADSRIHRFHRAAARAFHARGALRLHALALDGEVRGVLHGLAGREVTYLYLSGLDPAIDRLSPGTLLLGRAVLRALEEGHAAVDFLRGREPYKYDWGARDEPSLRRVIRHRA